MRNIPENQTVPEPCIYNSAASRLESNEEPPDNEMEWAAVHAEITDLENARFTALQQSKFTRNIPETGTGEASVNVGESPTSGVSQLSTEVSSWCVHVRQWNWEAGFGNPPHPV